MKIVITGGAGFIGSHTVEHFHRQAQVVVVDDLSSGFKHNLQGLDCQFVQESVLNREVLFSCCEGADYIFSMAAMVSVPESMAKPAECNDINLNGLINVLEAARRFKVKKVVLCSSAAVYGPSPVVPKVETMQPQPVSPYAVTKLAGEYYLEMYRQQYGVDSVALRYFNVFGPRQNPQGAYAAAVPIFIKQALANEPLTIYGDGRQIRDFIYVKDVVQANDMALAADFPAGVYNVAGGLEITIGELAKKIISLAGSSSEIRYVPKRDGDIFTSKASIDKISSHGFKPHFGMDEGLLATIQSMRK